MIWSLSHDYNTANFALKGDKVIIGDYVWIGPRAIILPSVSVGKYAVVAAGSVVTKDVSAYALVGGIPAKKLRERDASVAYNYRPGGRYSRFC
ncbi:MAG: acyltransferase [Verrucomicrobiota bacterium]